MRGFVTGPNNHPNRLRKRLFLDIECGYRHIVIAMIIAGIMT